SDKSVSCDDFLICRIPCNQLLIASFASIILIQIQSKSGSTSGISECYFSKPSYFSKDIGCIMMIDQIDMIFAIVGMSEKSFLSQLLNQNCLVYLINYCFYTHYLVQDCSTLDSWMMPSLIQI